MAKVYEISNSAGGPRLRFTARTRCDALALYMVAQAGTIGPDESCVWIDRALAPGAMDRLTTAGWRQVN